jgi:hypothetical protein
MLLWVCEGLTFDRRKRACKVQWIFYTRCITTNSRSQFTFTMISLKYDLRQVLQQYLFLIVNCSSAESIATDYRLDDQRVKNFHLSISSRPDDLGSPSLLYNGYWGDLPWGQSGRGVKITTHLQPVLRSRKCGSIYPLPPPPYAFTAQCVVS